MYLPERKKLCTQGAAIMPSRVAFSGPDQSSGMIDDTETFLSCLHNPFALRLFHLPSEEKIPLDMTLPLQVMHLEQCWLNRPLITNSSREILNARATFPDLLQEHKALEQSVRLQANPSRQEEAPPTPESPLLWYVQALQTVAGHASSLVSNAAPAESNDG